MTYTAVSLFSGAGVFDYGVSRAGFDILAQVEIEPFCRKVLEKHKPQYWPNSTILEDVRNAGRHNLPANPAFCYGGFPCTDISVAGKQAGITPETRSGLWFEFARIIGEIRPRYVLLENVPAITAPRKLPDGTYRQSDGLLVIAGLTALGYDCDWGVISAADAGAPHRRERWWCVAHANARRWGQELASNEDGLAQRDGKAPADSQPTERRTNDRPERYSDRQHLLLAIGPEAADRPAICGEELGNTPSQRLPWPRQPRLDPLETQRGSGLVIQLERSGGELAHPDGQWQPQRQRDVSQFGGRTEHSSEKLAHATGSRRTPRGTEFKARGRNASSFDGGDTGVGQADAYGQPARHGYDGAPGVFPNSLSQDEGRGATLPDQNVGNAFTSVGRAAIRTAARMDQRLWPARPGEAQRSWERPRTTKEKVPDRASRLKALGNSGIWQIVYALATEIRAQLEAEDNAVATGGR